MSATTRRSWGTRCLALLSMPNDRSQPAMVRSVAALSSNAETTAPVPVPRSSSREPSTGGAAASRWRATASKRGAQIRSYASAIVSYERQSAMAGTVRLFGDRRRGLPSGNRRPPPAVRPRLREFREVRRLHPFRPKTALLEERRNVPCDMTAFEQPSGQRLRPLLPAPDSRLGRQAMLEEDELAAWLQDPLDTSQRLQDTRYGAQREGTHDGIDRIVRQGDCFARKAQEFDIELRAAPLPLGQFNHPPVGFERVYLADPLGIVVNEIHAGSHADLEDVPLSPANDSLPDLADRRGIAERSDNQRVDVISIEGHRSLGQSDAPHQISIPGIAAPRLEIGIDGEVYHAVRPFRIGTASPWTAVGTSQGR